MKKLLVVSVVMGVILTLVSLVRVSGQSPPMVPCVGVGSGCVPGVVINTPSDDVTGHRGWPLAVFYLQKDDDGSSTYEGYSVLGIVGDIAAFSLLSLLVLLAFKKLQKR